MIKFILNILTWKKLTNVNNMNQFVEVVMTMNRLRQSLGFQNLKHRRYLFLYVKMVGGFSAADIISAADMKICSRF